MQALGVVTEVSEMVRIRTQMKALAVIAVRQRHHGLVAQEDGKPFTASLHQDVASICSLQAFELSRQYVAAQGMRS